MHGSEIIKSAYPEYGGSQMKTRQLFLVTVALLATALSAGLSTCLGQGSLTPPGPPGATMLTLSQVEPRTPVDAVHTPGASFVQFIISSPGSYYLTTNIVVTNSSLNGIYIQANNVTLDLKGFSVIGAPGSQYGIVIEGYTNVSVRDGLISGWPLFGIDCAATHVDLDQLTISGGGTGGILLTGPGGCIVRNCIISGNTSYGIECLANDVALDHLMVSSNNPGLFFSGVASGVIKDCTVNENFTAGVECVSSTNMTLEDLTSSHNYGYGLDLNTFENGTVSDCKINGNANNTGIYLNGSSCLILGNSCSGNGNSIFVQGANNQIDGNHGIGSNPSAVGIWINGGAAFTNNIVTRNFVMGYGLNDYALPTGQIAGPIITNAVSGLITNSNPWANFGF